MAELECVFGVSGSGKTYYLRHRMMRESRRWVVIDPNAEWKRIPDRSIIAVRDKAGLDACFADYDIIVYQTDDPATATEQALELALAQPGTGLVCPEAHEAFPNKPLTSLPDSIRTALTRYRHHGLTLLLDTQRLTQLQTTASSNASSTRVFATVGQRDRARLADIGGRELVDAVEECTLRYSRDEPGWHVHYGRAPIPPFTLERV